jgi:hypothetical protein
MHLERVMSCGSFEGKKTADKEGIQSIRLHSHNVPKANNRDSEFLDLNEEVVKIEILFLAFMNY